MQDRRSFVRGLAAAPAMLAGPSSAQPSTPPRAAPLADAGPGVVLEPGVHAVTSNMTVKRDMLVMPGATVDIAAGRTLTLLGGLIAPVTQIFTGGGRVDMMASRIPAAHPEWWGAAPGDSFRDSLPALTACIAAHPTTSLLANDYFISNTLVIDRSHRRIQGAGSYWHAANQGTRLVLVSGAGDVVQVGTAAKPASIDQFVQKVELRDIELARSEPPRARGGDRGAAPAGLRVRFVLFCHFERLTAPEHAIGYSVTGAVYSFLRGCHAFRSTGGAPFFWGFHFDGRADIGLAGGNASLYVDQCGAAAGGPPGLDSAIGAYVQGMFSDTFLSGFETSQMARGILVDGMAASLPAAKREAGQINLHITQPVIDQCGVSGIELTGLSEHALVDIVDPYVGSGHGSVAGLAMRGCGGLTTVTGGQLIGAYDAARGGSATGILAERSEGLDLRGTKLLGYRRPVVLETCRDMQIDAAINNQGYKSDGAAIRLEGCARVMLRPRVKGTRGMFPAGVALAGGSHDVAVDASGIDPACLTGPKLIGSAPGSVVTGLAN